MDTGTSKRLLDTAESLFMLHGFEATSIRQLTAAAGTNLAAVNYHFGSKHGLIQAVFDRRMGWLDAERLRRLDEMEDACGGKPLRPSHILDAFFGPLLVIGEHDSLGGTVFLKLLGRTVTRPAEFAHIRLRDQGAVIDRYREALCRALPGTPRAEIEWRFHFMLGATAHAIASIDADGPAGTEGAGMRPHFLRERLMPFLLGGLRAELPAEFRN